MANKTIPLVKVRQILRLYGQGQSKLQISSITGIARNTVKRYLRKLDINQCSLETVIALSDFELQNFIWSLHDERGRSDPRLEALQKLLPEINEQLKRNGATLIKLWKQYRQMCPDGYKVSQFCYHYHQYLKQSNPVLTRD